MPSSLKTRAFVVILFGLAAGATSSFLMSEDKPMRSIASMNPSQGFAKNRIQGKSLALVQVALQAPQGIPTFESDEVTLVGWIRLNQSVNEKLRFAWEIPNDVQVMDGAISGEWSNVQKGQTLEVRITVRGFSQEILKMIALNGYINAGETEFGNSALLTSRPDDSYELITGSSVASENVGSQKVRAASQGPTQRPPLRGKIYR